MIPANSRFINLLKQILHPRENDSSRRGKTLLIVVSDDRFFMSHRLDIGRAAVKSGWRVIVAAGENGCRDAILSEGMEYEALPDPTQGAGPFAVLRSLNILSGLLRRNPDCILHLVGVKMMMLGNMAAGFVGHKGAIVNAVSGLGISFQKTDSIKARTLAGVLRLLWPRKKVHTTIFQNREDEQLLKHYGVLTNDEDIEFIKGSGVDLSNFGHRQSLRTLSDGRLRVIFSGRMLRSKGVTDLIEAAEMLRRKWGRRAQFLLCGATHHNPESLTADELSRLCDGKYIRWAGHCSNMPQLLASSRIMAFPSYYREGLPKSLIEASAVGLPIITCDSVGCRDTIDGNGVLVEPRNPRQLADEIDRLLGNEELCEEMGRRSRALAERDYDLKEVVRCHLEIYNRLHSALESHHSVMADQSLQCASMSV